MKPQLFDFNTHQLRMVLSESGEPWFVAKDVCACLGLSNPSMAVSGNENGNTPLDEDEKGIMIIETTGGPQKLLCVTEAGVYNLVFKGRKDEAKAFKRWITHEVLPAIRKTGQYSAAPTLPALPQTYKEAVRALLAEIEAKEALEAEAEKNAPMVAFYHVVAKSDDTIGMDEAAKLLGLGFGRNKMMKALRGMGVLNHRNVPYQQFIDRSYFRVIESSYEDSKGDSHVTLTTRVFQRGVEYLRRRFHIPQPTGLPVKQIA